MKRVLNAACGKSVYLYLPFGFCIEGTLLKRGKDGYCFTCNNGSSTAKFLASDVIAVNAFTGRSFALKGAETRGLKKA